MTLSKASSQLIILGFGGHARSVADVALAVGYHSLVFIDDNARAGEMFLGFPVLTSFQPDEPASWCAFAASGNSQTRKAQRAFIQANGWRPISLIAPSASIGVGATVDECVFVGQQAHIGPMAVVGKGSIINSGAVVEHECVVGEWAHVSVNATMAGRSRLGNYSMLGAGATVIDGVSVSAQVVVGAGAVVHRTIAEAGVYVGVPAMKISP